MQANFKNFLLPHFSNLPHFAKKNKNDQIKSQVKKIFEKVFGIVQPSSLRSLAGGIFFAACQPIFKYFKMVFGGAEKFTCHL